MQLQARRDYSLLDISDLADEYQNRVVRHVRLFHQNPEQLLSPADLSRELLHEAYAMDVQTKCTFYTRNGSLRTLQGRLKRARANPEKYPVHGAFMAQLNTDGVSIEGWHMLVEIKRIRNTMAHRSVSSATEADIKTWNTALHGTDNDFMQLKKIVEALTSESNDPDDDDQCCP